MSVKGPIIPPPSGPAQSGSEFRALGVRQDYGDGSSPVPLLTEQWHTETSASVINLAYTPRRRSACSEIVAGV